MPEDEHDAINKEATEIIKAHGYRANQAHCAVEAKPPVVWNKGKAAEYILNHQFGEDWRNKIHVSDFVRFRHKYLIKLNIQLFRPFLLEMTQPVSFQKSDTRKICQKVFILLSPLSDEDIFELLKGTGITFRVTKDLNIETKATYKVPSTQAVTKILQWLDKKFYRTSQ